MGEHSTPKSLNQINVIKSLGKILGYFVKLEYPIQKNNRTPQAIDIAWFINDNDPFPIMIFEIESKISNSIYNNVVKIYAKNSQELEKPLFFFHILIAKKYCGHKIDDLKSQYGNNNYKAYIVEKSFTNELIIDILKQNKRINKNCDIHELLLFLSLYIDDENYNFDIINNYLIDNYVGEREELLLIYSYLAMENQIFKKYFLDLLIKEKNLYENIFNTYLGNYYATPIFIGIKNLMTDISEGLLLDEFKTWQENDGCLKKIFPYFGLNYDYEEFILGCSGAYLCLILATIKNKTKIVEYVMTIADDIFEKLPKNEKYYSHFVVWMLYATVAINDTERFNNYKKFINDNNGFFIKYLENPPSTISFDEMNDIEDMKKIFIPDMINFKENYWESKRAIKENLCLEEYCISLLSSEDAMLGWNNKILYYLFN